MTLANDNFWGYTSDLLFRYRVSWLEAATVQPFWTSVLVCYVEGDQGHLLGEEVQQQKFRSRVRGTAHSFHMPWEDILEELKGHCEDHHKEAGLLPRSPECLKYVLKVHMRVDRQNMERCMVGLNIHFKEGVSKLALKA